MIVFIWSFQEAGSMIIGCPLIQRSRTSMYKHFRSAPPLQEGVHHNAWCRSTFVVCKPWLLCGTPLKVLAEIFHEAGHFFLFPGIIFPVGFLAWVLGYKLVTLQEFINVINLNCMISVRWPPLKWISSISIMVRRKKEFLPFHDKITLLLMFLWNNP